MWTTDEQIEAVYQIIRETVALAEELPFPEFRKLLETALGDRKPQAGSLPWLLLPIFTCEALGSDLPAARQIAAALEIGRIAAGCLDEWQDQDTDGALWRSLGAARTVNLAMGLLPFSFLTLSGLAALGVETSLAQSLQDEFYWALLHLCAGQDADLAEGLSLDDYERVAGAKSGALFRLGCRAGARVAGAAPEAVAGYGEFGYNLGVVAQIWNDFEGLAGRRGKGDAGQRRRSLPTLAVQAGADTETGPLYALVRLQVYHQRAAEALVRCPEAGQLMLFLDAYSTRRLVELAEQAAAGPEEDHAR